MNTFNNNKLHSTKIIRPDKTTNHFAYTVSNITYDTIEKTNNTCTDQKRKVAKTPQQRRNNLSPARLYMQLKYIYGSGCMQKRCQSRLQRRKSRSTPTAQCALLQFCIMTNPGDAFRRGESWTAAICELYEYSAVANADHEYVYGFGFITRRFENFLHDIPIQKGRKSIFFRFKQFSMNSHKSDFKSQF